MITKKILIVDDDIQIGNLEQEVLEQRGCVRPERQTGSGGSGYCPYCGGEVTKSFEFCRKCGRRLP